MEIRLNVRQVKILSDIGREIVEAQRRRAAVVEAILAGADATGPVEVVQRPDGIYLVRVEPAPTPEEAP